MSESTSSAKQRPKRRRWLSFSIRGLMLFTLVVSCLLGWIGRDLYQYRTERSLYLEIEAAGGSGMIMPKGADAYQFGMEGSAELSLYQRAISWVMGEHFFYRIFVLQLPKEDINQHVAKLPHFSELAILYVQDSSIDDDFIQHLAQVTTLQQLSFRGSEFENVRFQNLASLRHLREISFTQCQLSNSLLSQLKSLKHLEKLSFENTSLTDDGVKQLDSIPNLQHLEIMLEESITEGATAHLGNCPSLRTVRLVHVPIDDESLRGLSRSRNLEVIEVIGTEIDFQVSKQGLQHLQKLNCLKNLSLEYVALQNEHLESVGQLIELESFSCNGKHLSNAGLQHLKQLNNLESLSIIGAKPTLAGLESLSSLPKLTRINLGAKLDLTLPEKAVLYGVPYGKSRAEYFQRVRGRSTCCLDFPLTFEGPPVPRLEKPMEPLPPAFADVYNDPFIPFDAEAKTTKSLEMKDPFQ